MASARATPRQQAVHRKPLLNVVLDSSVHRSSDLAFGIASHEERDQSGGTSLMRRVSSGPLIPGITTSVRSRSISVPRLLATYAARYPPIFRAWRVTSHTVGSSSTSRIVAGIGLRPLVRVESCLKSSLNPWCILRTPEFAVCQRRS